MLISDNCENVLTSFTQFKFSVEIFNIRAEGRNTEHAKIFEVSNYVSLLNIRVTS